MQVFCAYSGIQLAVIDDGLPNAVLSHHPIFDMGLSELYKLIQKIQESTGGKLKPIQQRLFYLAMLKSTGLVLWETPFYPSDEEIVATYPALLRLMHIIPSKLPDHWNIPKLRISQENHLSIDLSEIFKLWNKSLEECYESPKKKGKQDDDPLLESTVAYASPATALAVTSKWETLNIDHALKPEWITWAMEELISYHGNTYLESVYKDWERVLTIPSKKVDLKDENSIISLYEQLNELLPIDDKNRMRTYVVLKKLQNHLDHITSLSANLLGNKTRRIRTIIAEVASYKIISVSEEEDLGREEKVKSPKPLRENFSSAGDYLLALMAYKKGL